MMLKIHALSLLLTSALLFQCGTKVQPANNLSVMQQTNSQREKTVQSENGQGKSAKECDFSSYSTISISHFYPKMVVTAVKPKYPENAVKRKAQGWVLVKVLVNEEGDVEKACAINGDEELRLVAEASALQWKFKTNSDFIKARLKSKDPNKKKYIQTILPFHFVLSKDKAVVGITIMP